MSSAQLGSDTATQASGPTAVAMRFEVTTLPAGDVDRAKAFCQRPGWRLDKGRVPGHDPQRRSYFNRATFADPDGNQRQLQEITERLPDGCE
jgi:catechol 2,3-dioxygenase-like lactoylglutathione lyase family enzyme